MGPPQARVANGMSAQLDDVELALLAQLHLASGGAREGLAALREARASRRGMALLEARARFELGEHDAAVQSIRDLLAEQPGQPLPLYYLAQLLTRTGHQREALVALEQLVATAPEFPGALQGLASLVFPGPPYREILKRLHDALRPRTYLEIGVEHGTTLALAVHSEQVVGVDPVPRAPSRPLPACTRVFHLTSDAFFAQHRREDVFGQARVDLAFIDGMHWFDYALRDLCNVERWCSPASTIILHDCLPASPVAAARERQTSFWVGDTWKALECLLRERRDLKLAVVPCYPSGLVVIQGLDPAASALSDRLTALCAEYLPLPYPYRAGALPSHYPLVPNTEPQLSALIARLRATAEAPREAR